jgi:predicted SAM-dependent methyltransferase
VSARKPRWLGATNSDYGLPPFARREKLRGSIGAALRILVQIPIASWDGWRLRAAVGRSRRHALVSLGCGPHLPPCWIGGDLVRRPPEVRFVDLRRPLPFRTDSVDGLLLEHSLEHLMLDDAVRLMHECARVLRHDAPIRVVCPDARLVARMILDPRDGDGQAQIEFDRALHGWLDDNLVRWRTINRLSHQWGQHRALISPGCVIDLMSRAGFTRAGESPAYESRFFPILPSTHHRLAPPPSEAFAVEGLAPRGCRAFRMACECG